MISCQVSAIVCLVLLCAVCVASSHPRHHTHAASPRDCSLVNTRWIALDGRMYEIQGDPISDHTVMTSWALPSLQSKIRRHQSRHWIQPSLHHNDDLLNDSSNALHLHLSADCSSLIIHHQSIASVFYQSTTDPAIQNVHVVYMTHLDVGYTLPSTIDLINQYIQQNYPAAIDTAEQLAKANIDGKSPMFKWTTHPWMLSNLLLNTTGTTTPAILSRVEDGIQKGYIQWHALPFNMQSEVLEPSLYAAGIDINQRLNTKYNKENKKVASQKDVPGTTRGVIKSLNDGGVVALHIGVNDFSMPPGVPTSPELYGYCTPFWWVDPTSANNDNKLLTMYCLGYSNTPWGMIPELIVRIGSEVLVFLMRVDNTGPQTAADVLTGWKAVATMFPNATIKATSLDDFITAAIPQATTLPTITSEFGDSWIYGVASDPYKIRQYRALARARLQALNANVIHTNDTLLHMFDHNLIKIPEHTWGYNEGGIASGNWDNEWYDSNINTNQELITNINSFIEQRSYLDKALNISKENPEFYKIIEQQIDLAVPRRPDVSQLKTYPLNSNVPIQCGSVGVTLDAVTGAIIGLIQSDDSQWAAVNRTIGLMTYKSHSEAEFQDFITNYLYANCHNCVGCQFAKCDLSKAGAEVKEWHPIVQQAWLSTTATTCRVVMNATFDAEACTKYGAPKEVWIDMLINTGKRGGGIIIEHSLSWFQKRPTRMAESIWFTYNPSLETSSSSSPDMQQWELHKMNQWLSPYEVAVNGSKVLHAIWDGVRYGYRDSHQSSSSSTGKYLVINSLDAAVVSVGERSPISWRNGGGTIDCSQGLHFNLFNNAWSTNYPQMTLDTQDSFRFESHWHTYF